MAFKVTVKLFSHLRNDRFDESDVELEEGASTADLLSELKLDVSQVGVLMVNGRPGLMNQALAAGDRITIIPNIGGG